MVDTGSAEPPASTEASHVFDQTNGVLGPPKEESALEGAAADEKDHAARNGLTAGAVMNPGLGGMGGF